MSSIVSNPAKRQALLRMMALTSLQEISLDTPLRSFPSVLQVPVISSSRHFSAFEGVVCQRTSVRYRRTKCTTTTIYQIHGGKRRKSSSWSDPSLSSLSRTWFRHNAVITLRHFLDSIAQTTISEGEYFPENGTALPSTS